MNALRGAMGRGGRAVEGSCLENSRTMSTVGSNPTLSAQTLIAISVVARLTNILPTSLGL